MTPVSLPAPLASAQPMHLSPASLEFRSSRDLKAFVDGLNGRRASLSGDERFNLARALEECQFAMTINDDLGAYSAKQRKQFLAASRPGMPTPTNASPHTTPPTTRSVASASRHENLAEGYRGSLQRGRPTGRSPRTGSVGRSGPQREDEHRQPERVGTGADGPAHRIEQRRISRDRPAADAGS